VRLKEVEVDPAWRLVETPAARDHLRAVVDCARGSPQDPRPELMERGMSSDSTSNIVQHHLRSSLVEQLYAAAASSGKRWVISAGSSFSR
jgi:hypothetical protein